MSQPVPSAFPASRRRFPFRAGPLQIPLGERTIVMGVLNCTPDSFSDGGLYSSTGEAVRRLMAMVEEGADWIDLGGESTRPGASPVPAESQWERIGPVLAEARSLGLTLPFSVDTTSREVARRALEEGAVIVNDVSALRFDPGMADLVAGTGAGLILMHLRGEPRTMQENPHYDDVVSEVACCLSEAAGRARAAGVERERIVIDPGIGFGKTAEHNLEILRRLPELADCGLPLLVGASRKRFIGHVLDLPVTDRMEGSLAAHVAAVLGGAHIVRAHDVRATVRAVRVADAILGA